MFTDATIVKQGNNYFAKYGDDNNLFAEFYINAVKNEEKSIEAGRPIYEDKEFVVIRIAGDTKTVVDRPVKTQYEGNNPPDTERFARQYQAFKAKQEQKIEGTPLEEWAILGKSDVASMRAINIHTVEQLANLGDNNMNWLGARSYKDKAIAWLAQAKDGAGMSILSAENEKLKNDMAALKAQMDVLITMKSTKPKRKDDVEDGADIT